MCFPSFVLVRTSDTALVICSCNRDWVQGGAARVSSGEPSASPATGEGTKCIITVIIIITIMISLKCSMYTSAV